MVDQVNLKWNDFEENVKIAFKDFREILNDVVLYCGNEKTFANKLVLCACSEVFKSMLLATDMTTQIYPSILLWDTNINELNQILDFMYFGEVKVTEPGLASFLALAERLQVKGLCGKDGSTPHHTPQPLSPPLDPSPARRVYPVLEEISGNEDRNTGWNTPKKARFESSTPIVARKSNQHTSSERLYPSNNENKGTELEPYGSVKQELGLDEVIPLEPEQLLLEGPGTYYEEKRKGYKGFKGDLNYPLDTSGYYGFESGDMDLGNLDPNHSLDPNHPFQCCICMKRYKSQGPCLHLIP